MTRDKSKWRWQVKGCNGQRRGTTAALPPPCTCASSRGPGRATPRPGGTSSQRPLAWHTSATTQNEGSTWHHTWQSVLCVHGRERPAEGSVRVPHWVPMCARARARESNPPPPTLSAHGHAEAPSGVTHTARPRAARAFDARHAPSTVPPLGSEARAVDASSRGSPVSAADPASAASPARPTENKCLKFTPTFLLTKLRRRR